MKTMKIPFAVAAAALIALPASIDAQPSTRVFMAGAATSNITPPLGCEILGGWDPKFATHIHDELHARCLVLDDGATRLVFAVVDNVGIPRETFDAAKRLIHDATGVPLDHMLMSSTHTHSAAKVGGVSAGSGSKPRPSAAACEPGSAAGGERWSYEAFLIQRIADGVRRAINNLEPARIGWGACQVPQHVFNRRWLLKDGKTGVNPLGGADRAVMNPGFGRDDLLKPAGPTNSEVYFVSVQSIDGRPIALLANYWLHYVGRVGNGHISADYFGAFCDRIQQLLGADRQELPFVGILANGPCGDVNNNNYNATQEEYAPYEKIRLVADDVAQAVLEEHKNIRHLDWVELKAAHSELTLKMRRPTPEHLRRAEQVLARPATVSPIHIREVNYARLLLAIKDWPESLTIVLQAFRIGDLGIAAVPFEAFTETGLEIKARSPFKDTFTIELANGEHGYLPTPGQHELGGYETWLGINRVDKEASRTVVAELLKLFERLK